jgi:hypothetical protein
LIPREERYQATGAGSGDERLHRSFEGREVHGYPVTADDIESPGELRAMVQHVGPCEAKPAAHVGGLVGGRLAGDVEEFLGEIDTDDAVPEPGQSPCLGALPAPGIEDLEPLGTHKRKMGHKLTAH